MTRARRSIPTALGVGVALGVALLIGVSGCAPTPPAPITSGMLNVVLRHCIRTEGLPAGASVSIERLGWQLVSPSGVYTGGARGSSGPSIRSTSGAVTGERFARCVNEVPVDYSLALADGTAQRMRLYDWYRTALVPCLRRHGGNPPPLPSAEVFYAEPYGATDPYQFTVARTLGQAERLQAACPPASPAVRISANAMQGRLS